MTLQGWNPQSGIHPIPRGSNVYITQAPAEETKNNKENGTGNISITPKNQRVGKPWNNRQLARLK